MRVAAPVLGLLLAAALSGCGGGGGNGGGGGTTPAPPPAVNDPFYGVITGEPLPGDSQIDQLGRGKDGTLRLNFAWGSVQSGPDAGLDWSHYDPVVGRAAANGIEVLATVYSSPVWAEPTPEDPPLGAALPGFLEFVGAAVERYGPNGSFWKDNPSLPKVPITTWQLWNEPNSDTFWKPAPDAGAYVTLLQAFNSTVKGVDPGARILLGGLFPKPPDEGPVPEDFLAQVYASGGGGLIDAVDIHPYAATPKRALGIVEEVRGAVDRLGGAATPIWVTEIGWASGGDPSGVTVGAKRQAEYLTEAFNQLGANRQRLKLDRVMWYALNDQPGAIWVGHCGLFNLDGTPKPSWNAFVRLTGGTA